jgi:hypothetical protein
MRWMIGWVVQSAMLAVLFALISLITFYAAVLFGMLFLLMFLYQFNL